jgi:hypothetical protein
MRAVGDRLETMQYEHSQVLPFPWELIINQDSTFWGAYQMALYSLYSVLLLTRAHRALVPFGTQLVVWDSVGAPVTFPVIPFWLGEQDGIWDLGCRTRKPLSLAPVHPHFQRNHMVCVCSLPPVQF